MYKIVKTLISCRFCIMMVIWKNGDDVILLKIVGRIDLKRRSKRTLVL